MLHVVAVDDLSEVAGIQVNGLLFTTLEDGVLDVRMEEPLNSYKQLAIRAYDYAGNFSDPVTLDNPYYSEPTPTPAPTKKPTVTKQPTATPAPTSTPKATKKPNTGNDAESTKATKAPAAETAAQTEKQEPIVIILTPLPTAEPAPSPTPEIQYVPLGPGQPFTQNGNMVTRDVLYQCDLFTDFEAVERERKLQRAMLEVRRRYGMNAVVKGMNLLEGATTIERNSQIGGHRAGSELPTEKGMKTPAQTMNVRKAGDKHDAGKYPNDA